MKKIAIITAMILTTALTAFSITHKENKADSARGGKIENNINAATANRATASLATAD